MGSRSQSRRSSPSQNLAALEASSESTPGSSQEMPFSPRKPGAGVAKRMLSRTRTEFELDMDVSRAAADEPPTRPSTPSGPSRPGTPFNSLSRSFSKTNILSGSPSRPSLGGPSQSQTQDSNLVSLDVDGSPPPSRPVARTYSKSRSFLVNLSSSVLEPGSGVSSQDMAIRESYSDLRARWGVDMSEVRRNTFLRSPTI